MSSGKTSGSGSRKLIYLGKEAESCDATDACDAALVGGSGPQEPDQEPPLSESSAELEPQGWPLLPARGDLG